MSFQDHFSSVHGYTTFRPTYPAKLFDWLAEMAPDNEFVWDCATGGGQAATDLARRFRKVWATDASAEQLSQATPHPRITYRVATAEQSGLDDHCADLITVAQAYHWFDHRTFLDEAERVLKPDGVLAVWTYDLLKISTEVDALVERFYREAVGAYWPQQRRHVERGYCDLPFLKARLETTEFVMHARWTPQALLGYLGTWSATRRSQARGRNPLPEFSRALEKHWRDGERTVRFPLTVLAARSKTRTSSGNE